MKDVHSGYGDIKHSSWSVCHLTACRWAIGKPGLVWKPTVRAGRRTEEWPTAYRRIILVATTVERLTCDSIGQIRGP